MNVTLIPFLLAANLAGQDLNEEGNYLEYTFQSEGRIYLNSTHYIRNNSTSFHAELFVSLKCRPKDNITITCRLHEVVIRQSNRENEFRPPLNSGGDTPFDIIFNENGVESFVTIVTELDMFKHILKEIGETLSVGTDLRNITSLPAEFKSVENTLMGPIDTTYNVNLVPAADLPFTIPDRQQNFTLNLLPIPQGNPGYYMVIEKERNVFHADSVQKALESVNKEDVRVNVTSSTAKMYIGSATGFFKSITTVTSERIDRYENSKRKTWFKISFSTLLEKIEWTNEEWPTLSETETDTMRIENYIRDVIVKEL